VPDTDVAALPDPAAEGLPRRQVFALGVPGVRLQHVERLPVLDQYGCPKPDPRPRRQQAALGVGFEFAEHPRHGEQHREPLVNLPQRVDPHADQEDDEVAVHLRSHAFGDDAGHASVVRDPSG